MKTYIGTEIVKAIPMTHTQYVNKYTWINIGKDVSLEGYMVEYDNGHKSWSPKHVFEKHYVEISNKTMIVEQIMDTTYNKDDQYDMKLSGTYYPTLRAITSTLQFLKVIE